MRDSLNIEIAGVNFSTICRDKVILKKSSLNYNSFIKKEQKHSDIDINISLELNNMPDIGRLTEIFNSGESWSMFRDANDYFVVLNPPTLDKKPIWIARIDNQVKKVNVYLNGVLSDKNANEVAVINPISYPLDQILLMYFLAQREGALIHAAGTEFNGKGYIFAGKSGAGKSTLTKQLYCINDFFLLSDDRMVVRKIKNTFKAFGTPWPGEEGIAVNKSVELSGIFFISQASYNRIEEINYQKALEKLLPVVSIPWYDRDALTKILDFCGDLISHIPAYEFHFKTDREAGNVFEKFISK